MNRRICTILFFSLCLTTVAASALSKKAVSPPTISPISDQVTQRNQAKGPIPFTVGDPDTNLDSLFVTGTSQDTSLIKDENIVFGGGGADRTVTITPSLNKTGTTSITITVSDGTESVSDTFKLKVNDPPRLDMNSPLVINEGATGTISGDLLQAVDLDNTTTQLVFSVGPDSATGIAATSGVVKLNGTTLPLGGKFTQDDVNNNRVTFAHNGSENTADFFGFNVMDSDSGIASDGGFTVFHFNITINPVNDAPVAHDSSYIVGLGVSFNGHLKGSDPDSPNLTFSLTTSGTVGTAVITDSTTGAFTYTSGGSISATDSFFFRVNDGSLYSATPGRILVHIQNQPPVAYDGSRTTFEDLAFNDTLVASDPDLPHQELKFSLVENAHIGTVLLTDSLTGAFTYTPQSNTFGADSFAFQVNDGALTSPPGIFRISVRPKLATGDIIVADNNKKAVILVNPSNGAQFILSSGDSLLNARDVVVEASGNLVVLDGTTGLIRIDPRNGHQTTLTPGSSFTTGPLGPTSMALESNGSILVADGTAGIKRINPSNGSVSVVSSGDSLNLAIGVGVSSNGDIIAGDASAFIGQQSRILRINPSTGHQSVVSIGGTLALPIGIAIGDSGQIYVSDPASFVGAPSDYLSRIDPATGVQTLISPSETLHIPTGLDIDNNGKLIIANNQRGSLYRVDPSNGAASVISQSGSLQQPFGLTIVRPRAGFSLSNVKMHFGDVSVGSGATDSVTVTNTGDAPLFITSVTSDSSQFTVSPTSATIAASSSEKFYVSFTPTSSDTIISEIVFTHNAFPSRTVVTVSGSGIVTGVEDKQSTTPRQFALYNNFPNPFNPTTTLRFDVPQQSVVTIRIYSILGAEAATIVNHRQLAPGSYSERFDASHLSSGIYFYEMIGASKEGNTTLFRNVKKMVLVR